MKDNFSGQASDYSKFRPQYPDAMISHIVSLVAQKNAALDVATGNGQVAARLSDHFETVYATDISGDQLMHAPQLLNVIYRKLPAEHTDFEDAQFDLVTVAQAVHWFDFDLFYNEVRRILKPGGIFAVLGYGLLATNPESDQIIRHFYHDIVGPFWDPERIFLEEGYQTIPFPFAEIQAPQFTNAFTWNFDQLIGYLETWSAVSHYKAHHNQNPIDLIREPLRLSWEKSEQKAVFPMLLRIGANNP